VTPFLNDILSPEKRAACYPSAARGVTANFLGEVVTRLALCGSMAVDRKKPGDFNMAMLGAAYVHGLALADPDAAQNEGGPIRAWLSAFKYPDSYTWLTGEIAKHSRLFEFLALRLAGIAPIPNSSIFNYCVELAREHPEPPTLTMGQCLPGAATAFLARKFGQEVLLALPDQIMYPSYDTDEALRDVLEAARLVAAVLQTNNNADPALLRTTRVLSPKVAALEAIDLVRANLEGIKALAGMIALAGGKLDERAFGSPGRVNAKVFLEWKADAIERSKPTPPAAPQRRRVSLPGSFR